MRDHPRVCGEKAQMVLGLKNRWGSPPRVRGKAQMLPCRPVIEGITPACAGKSVVEVCGRIRCRDHPRVCGEKSSGTSSASSGTGSPPRVRGKGRPTPRPCRSPGITPACAGKRRRSARRATSAWDHPRVCGEKPSYPTFGASAEGSPPRVRGKASMRGHYLLMGRITPACAGKSGSVCYNQYGRWDHPRVCGEKSSS